MVETLEGADPVPFHAVCVFEASGSTFMMLEQGAALDAFSEPEFLLVTADQISRLIVVEEHGAERLFVSHMQGLGSVMPLYPAQTSLCIVCIFPVTVTKFGLSLLQAVRHSAPVTQPAEEFW